MVDAETDELLDPGEVAERLNVSPSSAHRLMQSGAFPIIDISPEGSQRKRLRVRTRVFSSWLESRTA